MIDHPRGIYSFLVGLFKSFGGSFSEEIRICLTWQIEKKAIAYNLSIKVSRFDLINSMHGIRVSSYYSVNLPAFTVIEP